MLTLRGMCCRALTRLPPPPPAVQHCRRPPPLCNQGNIKRDPLGYSDEFQLQWRHYKACLQLFLLKPSQEGGEFADLVSFIAQVTRGGGSPGWLCAGFRQQFLCFEVARAAAGCAGAAVQWAVAGEGEVQKHEGHTVWR